MEDDKPSKLILEKLRRFEDIPREVWFQFADRETYSACEQEFLQDLGNAPRGQEIVVVYLKDVRAMKKLPLAYCVSAEEEWLRVMQAKYGEENIRIVQRKMRSL